MPPRTGVGLASVPPGAPSSGQDRPASRFLEQDWQPVALGRDGPPLLYVVVDTEAEFDWHRPFARDLVAVRAMAAQERAQAIFDRHGLRPVYVVDYPVASQPEGAAPLIAIHARGGCEIGAHLHPWTNPPFDEAISARNSYPGNLPPALEAAKLERLLAAIEQGFGLRPRFYKAGRYGIGPQTLALIARHGMRVDFSVLPGADFSGLGGPDFAPLQARPYRVRPGPGLPPVLSLPMTRGHVGVLGGLEPALAGLLATRPARALRLRGALDAIGLMRKATLTPEGVPATLQTALLRRLAAHGERVFVLHYHSPSLVPGNTPYVRDAADLAEFLARIETVCRFFMDEVGGRAGDPRALLALADG